MDLAWVEGLAHRCPEVERIVMIRDDVAGAEDFIWWKAHNLNRHLLSLFHLGSQEDGSTPVPPTPW